MKQYLRYLPAIHDLQKDNRFQAFCEEYSISQARLTKLVQNEIDILRNRLLLNKDASGSKNKDDFSSFIFTQLESTVKKASTYYLKKIINATGTILHTNLGRARLSQRAIEHVVQVAQNYSNLEFEIEEGIRGSRHSIIEELIKEVIGAEAAMVVNNNAASVYLILCALAKDKEVIVSRGQLVEIGGSFRISSIMEESGAKLVEVGTTNKTHIFDYENAITENTAIVMKVHTSNFKTIGFTKSVETSQLIELKNNIDKEFIFYEDLGSGVLYDFREHKIGDEPLVSQVIKEGADIVSFSGDKLLGGPQAGIIAGKKEIIQRLKKHQLARVLRVDKMTLAALEATLHSYVGGEDSIMEIPTIRDLIQPLEEIKSRAEKFANHINEFNNEAVKVEISEDTSMVGGGTMPDVLLQTFVVEVKHDSLSCNKLAHKLRNGSPSIVTRTKDEKVLFDLRTITSEEVEIILNRLKEIF